MKQTNKITHKMGQTQDRLYVDFPIKPKPNQKDYLSPEAKHGNQAVVYRLYTEDKHNLREITSRYFPGASLIPVFGLWEGELEKGIVIEVIGTTLDLQSIVHLAGDIRQVNHQSSVLVTWNNVSLLNVTADV